MKGKEAEVGRLIAIAGGPFTKGINATVGEAIIGEGLLEGALCMCGYPDRRIAFRVAWAVEYVYFKDRTHLAPYHDRLIANFLGASTESTRRVYGKIVWDLLKSGSPATEPRLEPVAEKAFDLLTSPGVKVASKVWAMEILYLLRDRIDWVDENLAPTVEHQAALSPTPAMTNHAGKLLRRLAGMKNRK